MAERHGRRHTTEYRIWENMKARCANPRNRNYRKYGARGIVVCERWRNDFAAFFADMGPRPSGDHSIDRIDPNGNYEPSNCRWATQVEQNRNRRDNVTIEARGQTKCMAAWAEEAGMPLATMWNRYRRGDRGERLLRPVDVRSRNGLARIRQRPAKDTTNLHGCTSPVRCGECAACRKAEGR